MLPDTGELLKQDFKIVSRPTRGYRLNRDNIAGYVDQLEAVKQSAMCILNTERYDWLIYSWNYGVELKDLYGKPMGLVKSKLKKRITEALTQDDRILSVSAFVFVPEGRKLLVSFAVRTVYGEFEQEMEVKA